VITFDRNTQDIFWNWDVNQKIMDVEVVFVPRDLDTPEDNGYGRRMDAYMRRWDAGTGNSFSNWLRGADLTPEGVFAHLLYTGFASQTELRRAIEEFGHIEQCAWAWKMLRGFHA
jgi:hypothetical protein